MPHIHHLQSYNNKKCPSLNWISSEKTKCCRLKVTSCSVLMRLKAQAQEENKHWLQITKRPQQFPIDSGVSKANTMLVCPLVCANIYSRLFTSKTETWVLNSTYWYAVDYQQQNIKKIIIFLACFEFTVAAMINWYQKLCDCHK